MRHCLILIANDIFLIHWNTHIYTVHTHTYVQMTTLQAFDLKIEFSIQCVCVWTFTSPYHTTKVFQIYTAAAAAAC